MLNHSPVAGEAGPLCPTSWWPPREPGMGMYKGPKTRWNNSTFIRPFVGVKNIQFTIFIRLIYTELQVHLKLVAANLVGPEGVLDLIWPWNMKCCSRIRVLKMVYIVWVVFHSLYTILYIHSRTRGWTVSHALKHTTCSKRFDLNCKTHWRILEKIFCKKRRHKKTCVTQKFPAVQIPSQPNLPI